jgi:Ca2+-dependent lipid-binding protein
MFILFSYSYRTKAKTGTLNPVWNQAFVLTAEDGLHYADFVKLAVKDESRSGVDSNMGAGSYPAVELQTYRQ